MTAGAAIGFAPVPGCTTTVDMLVPPLCFCFFPVRVCDTPKSTRNGEVAKLTSFTQSGSVLALSPQIIISKNLKNNAIKMRPR